ncbi:hypothetical protein TRVL_06541 [Trypanosoma vivax]|nr:hypothetical protein TRVL_06541 [Trypanosoma vivax]
MQEPKEEEKRMRRGCPRKRSIRWEGQRSGKKKANIEQSGKRKGADVNFTAQEPPKARIGENRCGKVTRLESGSRIRRGRAIRDEGRRRRYSVRIRTNDWGKKG